MNDYDRIAMEFENYGKEAVTDIEIGYQNALSLMGQVAGKKILDYGCGVGKFSRIIKDLGAEVVGIDVADKELSIAKNNHPDIEFMDIVSARQQFKKEFDLVALNFVVTAVSSPAVVAEIFEDIRAFLKPGGTLVMLNTNHEKSGNRNFLSFRIGEVVKELGHPITVFLGQNYDLPITDHYYPVDFLIESLAKAGLKHQHTIEPLADTRDRPWKDELVSPPFSIISAVTTQ